MKKPNATVENPPPHEAPDFAQFITELDEGEINDKLTDKLAEVVRGAQLTGKVGELNIKITVKSENGRAAVVVEAKAKVPEHALNATLFFVGNNGELLRKNPRQEVLKGLEAPTMRTVAFPAAPLENVRHAPLERPRAEPIARDERPIRKAPPVEPGYERPDLVDVDTNPED